MTVTPAAVSQVTPRQRWLLRQEQFRDYWLARLLSQTGQGALLYGLLILVVDQTSQSFYASLFVVCSILPSLVLGLVGGAVSDALEHRMLLVALNVVRGVLALLLLREGTGLVTIFVVTLGIWSVHQFVAPTESTVLARIVPVGQLGAGNALYSLAVTLSQLLGLVLLAPGLLRFSNPQALFGVCGLLFVLAAVFNIKMGHLPEQAVNHPNRSALSLRAGWRVLVATHLTYAAVLDAILVGVGLSTLVAIVPYYLLQVLDTGAENTVFVFAPAVIGVLLGLQFAPWLGRVLGYGRLATVGLVGFAVAITSLGLVDQVNQLLRALGVPLSPWAIDLGLTSRIQTTMVLSIPVGFFSSVTGVAARTILLEHAPPHLRGQAAATQNTIANVGALAPTLVAGAAIDWVGVQPVALAVALLLLIGALLGRRLGLVTETVP